MVKRLPIVCTLTGGEMVDRSAAWQALLEESLVARVRIAGGISLTVKPEAYPAMINLIELEKTCCAWIKFDADGATTVKMTAKGPGALVLAGMFLGA